MSIQNFIAIAHDAMVAAGLLNSPGRAALDRLITTGEERSQVETPAEAERQFTGLINEARPLLRSSITTQKEAAPTIARALALDAMVNNAYAQVTRAAAEPLPKEKIKAFLLQGKQGKNGAEFIRHVTQARDKIIISLVHTMHPTIYHTPEARAFEKQVIALFESCIMPGNKVQALSERKLREAEPQLRELVKAFAAKLNAGASITPLRPVTVVEETALERENIVAIRKTLQEVISSWNQAAEELKLKELTFDKKRAEEMIEMRTWGRGADADGREKSTSMQLYEEIEKEVAEHAKNAAYKPTIFDARQNAGVHRDLVSALIQVKHRDSRKGLFGEGINPETKAEYGRALKFNEFCEAFMQKHAYKEHYRSGKWNGPRYSIFQELLPEDQAAFLREMIKYHFTLVPAQVARNVRDVLPEMVKYKYTLINKYKSEITAQGAEHGISPGTITYDQMAQIAVELGDKKVSLQQMFDAGATRHGFTLSPNGLGYQNAIDPDSADSIQMMNFFKDRVRLEEQGDKAVHEKISSDERVTLMDTLKRLVVLNDAIDNHPDIHIADRHQIAEFANEADFYIALKLFQEAGLITINDEKVTNVKMGIQPLIEKLEDMEHAPAMFRRLLNDPMVESYFQKRGKAEIMLGFSDGAASAGNFASQWKIYELSQELTRIFAEQKPPIPLRIFQGRGRGVDRGGTVDPMLLADLMPPNANASGVTDVTIQADLPMDLAACRGYGLNYFTNMLLSNISGQVVQPTPHETQQRRTMEPVLAKIANRAAELYQSKEGVRENPDTLYYLNHAADQIFRSSRAPTRGNIAHAKKFDKVRAISKEYMYNGMDFPLYNYGLATALREVAGTSTSAEGKKLYPQLMQHPFFAAMTKTIRAGMMDFDPVIAKHYGVLIGKQDFIEHISKELTGLATTPFSPGGTAHRQPNMGSALDQAAHAIICATQPDKAAERNDSDGAKTHPMRPIPSLQPEWDATLRHLLFVTAQEIGHRQLPAPKASIELQ